MEETAVPGKKHRLTPSYSHGECNTWESTQLRWCLPAQVLSREVHLSEFLSWDFFEMFRGESDDLRHGLDNSFTGTPPFYRESSPHTMCMYINQSSQHGTGPNPMMGIPMTYSLHLQQMLWFGAQPLCCWLIVMPIQIDAKTWNNDWNPGTLVLIWD